MTLRNSRKLAVVLTVITAAAVAMFFVSPPARLASTRTGDPAIADTLRNAAGPGYNNLSAFILRDGEVTFGGLGTDHTSEFEIGSITKTFNGELLDSAVERGEVTYDTTVADILGQRATGTEVAGVTLVELARHTSGLPRVGKQKIRNIFAQVFGLNPYVGETCDFVLDNALSGSLKDRGQENYSNLGHALLGQLLASSSGITYAELLQRDIFDPLGMDNTYVALPGTVSSDAPRGKWGPGLPVQAWILDGSAPAGGIRSTPEDMAKYAQAIVDKQEPNPTWVQKDKYFRHNGATFGFTGELRIYPKKNAAVYVTGDTGTGVRDLVEAMEETL